MHPFLPFHGSVFDVFLPEGLGHSTQLETHVCKHVGVCIGGDSMLLVRSPQRAVRILLFTFVLSVTFLSYQVLFCFDTLGGEEFRNKMLT